MVKEDFDAETCRLVTKTWARDRLRAITTSIKGRRNPRQISED